MLSGQYPEGIWRLEVGLNRWILRVAAYGLLLRDDYPPFTLGLWEPATLEARGVAIAATAPAAARGESETAVGMGGVSGIPIWPDRPDAAFTARSAPAGTPVEASPGAAAERCPTDPVPPGGEADFFARPSAAAVPQDPEQRTTGAAEQA